MTDPKAVAAARYIADRTDEYGEFIAQVARALLAGEGPVSLTDAEKAALRWVDEWTKHPMGCEHWHTINHMMRRSSPSPSPSPVRDVTLREAPTPSPTGTELALDEAKQHIAILTKFWMDSDGWHEASEAARAFISGIPSSSPSPSPAVRDGPEGDPMCQCPKCGRMHRDLQAGKPPMAIAGPSLLRPAETLKAVPLTAPHTISPAVRDAPLREALRKALSVVKPFGLDDEETKIYREAHAALHPSVAEPDAPKQEKT